MKNIKEGANGQEKQQAHKAYDRLAAKVRKKIPTKICTTLFPVPNGIVSVTISKPTVTAGVAAGALALIGQGLKQNGIPKEPAVRLGGHVNMPGLEQDLLKFETGGDTKHNKKFALIHKHQQDLRELSDEELVALLGEGGDAHVIFFAVPKGIVSVGILGAEVALPVAVAALVLIKESILKNGIPHEHLLQLGGLVNIGPKSQK